MSRFRPVGTLAPALFLVLAANAHAAKTDVVVLRNGDRITREVKILRRGKLQVKREIFKDFFVSLKGYDSFDSDPATEGASQNDWGVTLGLGYSFS